MVLSTDILQVENGASFLNVDLHIHSYGGSDEVTDPEMTPEAIVNSAIRQGLHVIAITDHNSDENVQRTIEYGEQNYPGQILILAGVEVTTAHGHLLVYFAPHRIADLAKYLSRIELVGDMGAMNTRTAKSMSDAIDEAESLNGICIAAHIDREKSGFHMLAPGYQNWKRDIIMRPGLYGLEFDSSDNLVWYSEHDESGSAGAERRKLLQARRSVQQLAARPHLASIQGSDAHSMKEFEATTPNRSWTKIKLSEFSFEAVRIALIDPRARVRAVAAVPRSFPRIRGMAMTGGFLDGEIIHFSDNLNCFIGGRGTGKSTAIRAAAYALGLNDEFGEFGNCPDTVTLFCEDANGILYRYVRTRDGDMEVKAKEHKSISDVPADAFQIEYFGQGELAKVAEDPLNTPSLFQEFLDRHIDLRDLQETEVSLVTSVQGNAARLIPLERAFAQLVEKKKTLAEIETKLKVAEEGNLSEIVGTQSKLASERVIRDSVEGIGSGYAKGHSLSSLKCSFEQILLTAGECTEDEKSKRTVEKMRALLQRSNEAIEQQQMSLNSCLKTIAEELAPLVREMKSNHQRLNRELAVRIADLKAKGVDASMPGLRSLLQRKTELAGEIARIEQRADERTECRKERDVLLNRLRDVRDEMTSRRKQQLKAINANLRETIDDYTIFVKYDTAGITTEFEEFMKREMHGTHLQDSTISSICSHITPSELAGLIRASDVAGIEAKTQVSADWAQRIVEKLRYGHLLLELEVLAKLPKPVITVLTKSTPTREVPVLQLSDGQRHTILLTIAMLAESNTPLVIDQPEDDLDNAFIYTSIVGTLRAIKERRQVILVTHNANIAVLGDSELILPMHREGDTGRIGDRGSIDTDATKRRVIGILEGGEDAFRRRREMYNY